MRDIGSSGIGALYASTGNGLRLVCKGFAWLGGVMIALLGVMTAVSILGRFAYDIPGVYDLFDWLGPIPGDYEIMEMGTAIAVFAFLPHCHLTKAHVCVDIFTQWAGPRLLGLMLLLTNLLFTVSASVLTWQLYLGLQDKIRYGEATMMLGLPVSWGVAPGVFFLGLLSLTCAYTTVDVVVQMARGHFSDTGRALGGE